MTVIGPTEEETLRAIVIWCRQHDWGKTASLEWSYDGDGYYVIAGLIERNATPEGDIEERTIEMKADYALIRKWAGD